ncbi:Ubiquitin-conjugating enzyme E2 L3 [Thelohanellus kitauei]|uniref:Ubiquitin-conjugating enzyme E2 L3 n=1 Tax=Thelohanellus kitauei TaxID=669202 RepID=A0A0C2I530_THEKT|nr:Ubiquitin-conjugating enzyme E2 L3 [Thelohanellus kitauei]
MAASRRLKKDLEELAKDPISKNVKVKASDDNMYHWCLEINPRSEPFRKYKFIVRMIFPTEYPFKPPKLCFETPIYHPNVNEQGHFCLDSILPDQWKPATPAKRILTELLELIDSETLPSPIRIDIADEYVNNKEKFVKDAEKHCQAHAKIWIS